MTYTKVFATEEEIEELTALLKKAQSTPSMALSTADALGGRDFASMAWIRLRKQLHACALKHGLPEIEGYYGMTMDGEFVKEG